MILIDDHCDADLEFIAESFFEVLNPKTKAGTFHKKDSLIGRIENELSNDLKNNENVRANFWSYLLANKQTKLKTIVTGRPRVLQDIIDEIDSLFGNLIFSQNINYEEAILTPFGQRVTEVFNYSTLYRGKQICMDNCDQFKLNYCPYCNENTVSIISISSVLNAAQKKQALLQLDHFFPQVRYPYLSLSFFNLVPGCSSCNTQLKGEKDFKIDSHFNPFHRRFDDFFQFRLAVDLIRQATDVSIIYSNKRPYQNRAILDFKIIERYNVKAHKLAIYNLFTTLKNHSPKVNRALWRQFADGIGLFDSIKQQFLKANGVPLVKSEINNYQLGKLKRDIVVSLGILDN